MKILIVHHSSKISGSEKSMLDFLCGLKKQLLNKYQIDIACPKGDILGGKVEQLGYNVIYLPFFKYKKKYLSFIVSIFQQTLLTLHPVLKLLSVYVSSTSLSSRSDRMQNITIEISKLHLVSFEIYRG